MTTSLILSLFPGLGLLDHAFELEGFVVVRGPDILWGGDIHRFHPPPGRFDGIIGGPPCQAHSRLSGFVRHRYGPEAIAPDLIPEFARCVEDAQPDWYLMENVPDAPAPLTPNYTTTDILLNNRAFGGAQTRTRRIWFGIRGGPERSLLPHLDVVLFESPTQTPTVMASGVWAPGARARMSNKAGPSWSSVSHSLMAQGFPADYITRENTPFTAKGAQRLVGNGVPLPLGRAIAKAVKEALLS